MPESGSNEIPVEFSAFNTPLETGANLIEASAGTGKTYSIAMLVLRFVVEQKLSIEAILVVTFTKAATQELKTRIRSRLQDLRGYLTGASKAKNFDQPFIQWADQLPDSNDVINLVSQALAAIDNAAIFTIHGFCQRMLKQYALETGQLFDAKLTANLGALERSLSEDYWRKQMYKASGLKASLIGASFTTPASLLSSIRSLQEGMVILPKKQAIDEVIASIEHSSLTLSQSIETSLLTPLAELIASDTVCFKEPFVAAFESLSSTVLSWVSNKEEDLPLSVLKRLSYDQLLADALNGNKFRKTKALSGEERKHAFLEDAGVFAIDALDTLFDQIEQLSIALRLGLFTYLRDNLDTEKNALNVLSYNDLISRLAKAIDGENNVLTESLQHQFSVALIDEFQDTDQQQWTIFSKIYHTPKHYLYLIGDPKQAVYKFRGADIYSYLDAKHSAERSFTLENNYRSAPDLLESINYLYAKSQSPFLIDKIPYQPVNAGKEADQNWVGGTKAQALVLWCLEDNPEHKDGYWTSGLARDVIRDAVVNETVSLLDAKNDEGEQHLQPNDIAILVRGNDEAANYQWALQQAKVPAVINSKNSVFDCEEAVYLQQLLTALERPGDLQRLRQALVVPWFKLDGQAFDALCRDDLALQQYVMEFQEFQQRWLEFGLMAMMKSLLDSYQILLKLSHTDLAERRITNLHHLLEILQQVALDERLDMHKTLEWLTHAIQGEHREEGTELRLEQDQQAVNIVTIHSSKGLEYPVVFVPEPWYERKAKTEPGRHEVVTCHKGGELIADLGSAQLTEHFEQAQFEQQAEDLRLLYVAITRAANRCYLPWATVRTLKRDNQSAFAHLLEPHAGEDWRAKLSNLATAVDGIEFELIATELSATQLIATAETVVLLQAREVKRPIRQDWRMSSYSSLAYLSQHEHELPQDKSQEPLEGTELLPEATVLVLPKGAHTGNVLHDILENSSFAELKNLDPNEAHYADYLTLRDKSCIRYGLTLTEDTEPLLDDLLIRSVQAPLDSEDENFTLANIPDHACLKEMAFYFSINELQTSAINQLLGNESSYQSLSMRQLTGQLTGFIDLICLYEGRYYVMDYKSNSLSNYDALSLQNAMQQHNYGLQYFIYCVVLHHYLEQRLPNYNYEDHFGGVRYLFLRGMDQTQPMQGVFVDNPSLQIIEGLSNILHGGGK